jgi:hypothetical protein
MAVADSAHEASLRPRFGVIAGVAAVALLAGAALQALGPQPKVGEITVQLLVTNQRGGLEIVAAAINALGLIGLGVTLAFLFGSTRLRKPEISEWSRTGVLAGAALAGIGGLAYGVVISLKAHQFATQGAQTYMQADSLLRAPIVSVLQYGGLLGSLVLAVTFVLVALNAMRVGLLTRFLGYLGMTSAAASLLLLGSAPALFVEILWLLSMAVLLLGRWPSGDPPAWRSGKAEPWPTSAELRQERIRAAEVKQQRRRAPESKPAAEPRAEPVTAATQQTRATTPKRKRKRRK